MECFITAFPQQECLEREFLPKANTVFHIINKSDPDPHQNLVGSSFVHVPAFTRSHSLTHTEQQQTKQVDTRRIEKKTPFGDSEKVRA